MSDALIIFIKNPAPGRVKTRIAATEGHAKAMRIYLELMRHTRETALELDVNRFLFYGGSIKYGDDWSEEDFQKHLQAETDLGGRMSAAFQRVSETHDKAVIIGSDCASLTPETVREAFDALDEHPFVVGPTFDGGYYLLGMRRHMPELFKNVAWSTESVFATTTERIKSIGGTYHLTKKLSDIDYAEDWERYGWKLPEIDKKEFKRKYGNEFPSE